MVTFPCGNADPALAAMEIDQSVLESLPLPQRQKLCRQIRQQQVQRYNDWIKKAAKSTSVSSPKARRRNKKGTQVLFEMEARLVDAVARFDDREGRECLGKRVGFLKSVLHQHRLISSSEIKTIQVVVQVVDYAKVSGDRSWSGMSCVKEFE